MPQVEKFIQDSPFFALLPKKWEFHSKSTSAYSATHTHSLKTKIYYHHLSDPINRDRVFQDKVLISYGILGNRYEIYSVRDIFNAHYSFSQEAYRYSGKQVG